MEAVVSVVLPVRNGGEYLAEAVGSILGQSLNALELIVVDDHSDDSAIDRLPRDDPRLSVIRNPGRGVSSAFNAGLASARGRYVARMDADDVALPERLDRQVEYLESHPGVDVCGTCVEIFSVQDLGGGQRRYQAWLNACRTPERIARSIFIESPIPNPTVMFRVAALERLGGYADPDWPEDYDLFLRSHALGMRMGKPDGVLLRWREHPGRLTHTDNRYDRKRFQAAKAYYLARRRPDRETPLLIWGAGPGGRLFHDLLREQGTAVKGFLDVHPRRIGGRKRGLPVWPIEEVAASPDHFIVVAVGTAGVRPEIRGFLGNHGRIEGRDYLFVI